MDLIWTIALLVVGYFGYNWYTGLQQQVGTSHKPNDQVNEADNPSTESAEPIRNTSADYIDYEEVDD